LTADCLMLPGSAVGLLAALGNVHRISLWFVDAVDWVFYFGLSYLFLAIWDKNKGEPGERKSVGETSDRNV